MRTALAAAGATVTDGVRLTLLVLEHSGARLAIWADAARRVWTDRPAPGCTLIPVPRLALRRHVGGGRGHGRGGLTGITR
ncbi:MAG: hypothetical protein Q8N06_11075 [Hydrogenophaga sp.]|nr:hypothetical protein [Hydrogenophaga sp.]